jgi:predicted dehydrogenase
MQFALLGNHPDALDMAGALTASRRHGIAVYSGPPSGIEALQRRGILARAIGDLEEVLADPNVEAVIVAGNPGVRPEQLRRALQSERHVLCVYPPDQTPDLAYEAAMIQGDTRVELLPLMPDALHPGIRRLAELAGSSEGALGTVRLIEMERWSQGEVWTETDVTELKPSLPGWDVLRTLGGEIAEVSAFTAGEEIAAGAPLLLSGRFERGGVFHAGLVPNQYEPRWRFVVVGSRGQAELGFSSTVPGAARLRWPDANGSEHEEAWDAWDPWAGLVDVFDSMLRKSSTAEPESRVPDQPIYPTWQDAVRGLELDDAARRSVHRRRASALEYPEASEETGFKGTMTLLGCGLLWASLLLLILSAWVPWLGWAILPVLVVFLLLQLLRWVVPAKRQ